MKESLNIYANTAILTPHNNNNNNKIKSYVNIKTLPKGNQNFT